MAEGSKRCSVGGCGRSDRLKRGLCGMHYQRFRAYGEPEPSNRPSMGWNAPAPVGKRFGRWTVLAEAPPREQGRKQMRYWLCRCDCGVERELQRGSLLGGGTRSCGCSRDFGLAEHCTERGCSAPVEARTLCRVHYRAWLNFAAPLCSVAGCERPVHGMGMCDLHRAWVRRYGEPCKPERPRPKPNLQGYVAVTRNGRNRPEHIWLMEDLLGRPLKRTAGNRPIETVHHINGVKHDNRTSGTLDEDFRSGNLELWSNYHPSGQRVSDKIAWAVELLETYAPDRLA